MDIDNIRRVLGALGYEVKFDYETLIECDCDDIPCSCKLKDVTKCCWYRVLEGKNDVGGFDYRFNFQNSDYPYIGIGRGLPVIVRQVLQQANREQRFYTKITNKRETSGDRVTRLSWIAVESIDALHPKHREFVTKAYDNRDTFTLASQIRRLDETDRYDKEINLVITCLLLQALLTMEDSFQ